MELGPTGYAFLGLTAIVAMLVGVLMFAALRFASAARDSRRHAGDSRAESVLLSAALEDAIARLKAQERATAARAAASEQLSSDIVASLTSGLIVTDAAGVVQIVNPAARRILRLEREDARPLDEVVSAVPALADVISESRRTNAPVQRRTVRVERPGGAMHLGVTVSPLGEGGSGGAICLFTDLTQVVVLEEQLRFKEALARLGELTAGLAHEFRNGLATIHGYGRLLDPEALPPTQRAYVEGIRHETQALGEIVTNFLRFARPDPLTMAPIELRPLIERVAEDAPPGAVVITGTFGIIDADDVLLRQAFSNLVRNSLEACEAAAVAPQIVIEGRLDAAAAQVVVEVRDNGPGIAPGAADKLFHPFFTTRPGGTGLGLAIVQKIIVSHNGHVVAGTAPEGGAAFRITLPAST